MTDIRVETRGVEQVLAKADGLGPRLATALRETVTAETFALQRHVVQGKLSGQVLRARSGTLRRSITARVEEQDGRVAGIVGTNLVYGRIHEFGGVVHVPPLVPVRAKALHWVSPAGDVFAKRTKAHDVRIPERSYLRSALEDRRPSILAAIRAAIAKVFG